MRFYIKKDWVFSPLAFRVLFAAGLQKDMIKWLEQYNVNDSIETDTRTWHGQDGLFVTLIDSTIDDHVYEIYYLEIKDPDVAMLFKLTWL